MKTFATIGPTLFAAGYEVIPDKGKQPAINAWTTVEITAEKVNGWATNGKADCNVAIRTGTGQVAIYGADNDILDKTVAKRVREAFQARFGAGPVRIGMAPKSLMVYQGAPGFRKVTSATWVSPDGREHKFELMGEGCKFTGYGIHPDTRKPYDWPHGSLLDIEPWELPHLDLDAAAQWISDVLPGLMPADWQRKGQLTTGPRASDDPLENFKPPLEGVDIERARADLADLDPDMGYADWFAVGAGMAHQFSTANREAFDLWNSWSAKGSKYQAAEMADKWRSFTPDYTRTNAITYATIIKMVNAVRDEKEEQARDQALQAHIDAIAAAQDQKALREIAARIATDNHIDKLGKDMIADAMKSRFAAVTGKKVSIGAVRDLIGMTRQKEMARTVAADAPDWLDGWVYVTGEAKFFHLETKQKITADAFDKAFGRNMPPDNEGRVPSAAKVACDGWCIPVVYQTMYAPSLGAIFAIDGHECANEYRPESVPTAADLADSATLRGFEILDRHIALVVPDEHYRRHLMRWMAWVVRNPGLKVLWAPFIKGVEGDGKSVIGTMMAVAMGYENVGLLSPETLVGSVFNDWAVGRCLNIMEEMKLQGHNRHDAYNKIKPVITNPRIELHGKGKASRTVINTCNYMGFSNHKDALPLDKLDRRNFVLFTPWSSIGALHDMILATGVTVDAYWSALWDEVIKPRPDIVRAWFEQVDLTGFNPNSRAPDTRFKDSVVNMGISEEEQIAAEIIEGGCYGISKEVVSSSCLTRALEMNDPPILINTSRVNHLMNKLGYTPFGKVIKWDGKAHRVWVQDESLDRSQGDEQLVTQKIRTALDATKG